MRLLGIFLSFIIATQSWAHETHLKPKNKAAKLKPAKPKAVAGQASNIESSTSTSNTQEDQKLNEMLSMVIEDYTKHGGAMANENLKHVGRMVGLIRKNKAEIEALGISALDLEAAIYISDYAKSPHLIQKYMPEYANNSLATFMDHSSLSVREVNVLRKVFGISDARWDKIVAGIVGHDGPSIDGSWWKENYEKHVGKEYAAIYEKTGLIHAYLDRLDQGGLYQMPDGSLEGGLRKISYELYNQGNTKGNLKLTIQETFGSVHEKTKPQLDHLDSKLSPKFLPKGQVPAFIQKQRELFNQSSKFNSNIVYDDKNDQRIGVKLSDGNVSYAENLDDFWALLTKAQ